MLDGHNWLGEFSREFAGPTISSRGKGLEGSDKEEEILGLGLGWAGLVLGALPAEACFWRGDLGLGQRLKGDLSGAVCFWNAALEALGAH